MVKDTLNSIFDNLKERTTNPFLGTFIIVWLIHNAKLIYILIYFDKGLPLNSKLQIIRDYFTVNPFIWHTILVVGITMLVLVATYIMLAIARLLTDFFDRIVTPKVSEWTDKNSVVLKTEYVLLQTTLLEFEQRLKDERALRIVTEKERDVAEAKVIEENVSSSIKESSNADVKSSKFNRISTSILTEANVTKINSLIADIINMTTIEKNNVLIQILVRENVIRVTSESPNKSYASYGFTDYGIKFVDYWNDTHANT